MRITKEIGNFAFDNNTLCLVSEENKCRGVLDIRTYKKSKQAVPTSRWISNTSSSMNKCRMCFSIYNTRNASQNILCYLSLKSNKDDIQICYVGPVERRWLHSNIARIATRLFSPDVAHARKKMKCQFIVIIIIIRILIVSLWDSVYL
jgi:hypothetical protein